MRLGNIIPSKPSLEHICASFAHVGSILGHLGAILGASWGILEASWLQGGGSGGHLGFPSLVPRGLGIKGLQLRVYTSHTQVILPCKQLAETRQWEGVGEGAKSLRKSFYPASYVCVCVSVCVRAQLQGGLTARTPLFVKNSLS